MYTEFQTGDEYVDTKTSGRRTVIRICKNWVTGICRTEKWRTTKNRRGVENAGLENKRLEFGGHEKWQIAPMRSHTTLPRIYHANSLSIALIWVCQILVCHFPVLQFSYPSELWTGSRAEFCISIHLCLRPPGASTYWRV